MYEVRKTAVFEAWLQGLQNEALQLRISARFKHNERGNFGDWKMVGEGVGELRYHFGPGYRVYFTRRGHQIIVLLAGGDKSSQARDIAMATKLAKMDMHDG